MTEKQFTLTDTAKIIKDSLLTGISDANRQLTVSELVDCLNNLYEENEQLKNRLKQAIHEINDYTCSIKQLQDKIDVKEALLKQYEEENEQLKKENYELHKRLGDFEPFERYIKERTSKTSVNDIIGFVKTDEPTNSVELKKKLYK